MSEPDQQPETLLRDAVQAEQAEALEKALAGYGAAICMNPGEERAYMAKCSLLRRMGRYGEAVACAMAFAAALPNNASAHHELGLCLLYMKEYDTAVKAFEVALTLRPGMNAAWANMGIALARIGNVEQAIRCYDRAAGKAPVLSVPTPPPLTGKREFDAALNGLLSELMEGRGGCVQLIAEPPLAFKVSVALLATLLKDYDMDGVVVSMGKPSDMYRQALGKRIATRHPPYYVDVLAPSGIARPRPDSAELSAFELDRIASAVRIGLQRVAEQYGGEEHFVLLDDLSSVEFYNGPQVVQRFLGEFFRELSTLDIFSFVVLPEQKAARLAGPFTFSRKERLKVRSEWFMGL